MATIGVNLADILASQRLPDAPDDWSRTWGNHLISEIERGQARSLGNIDERLRSLEGAGPTSDVVANPGGMPITVLETVTIGPTDYTVGGSGGGAAFSGARLGLTANRTAQDFTGFETLSWNHEVFDDSGYYDPAQPTRLTIPAGVTRAVLHAGIALTALSLGADMTFDISKNSTSTGIGFTGNALAIDTIGRATITTGVIDVVEGDYFDVTVQVQGDTSVTLHQDGTFFSCHAATTVGTGGTGTADGVVEAMVFAEAASSVTATLTRSGGLPDVVGSFNVFSVVGTPTDQQVPVWSAANSQWEPGAVMGGGADTNDYVDTFLASVSGSDLTMTLGRTGALNDLIQTVAIPVPVVPILPGYGVPTFNEPHLSNIHGVPTDLQAVLYEAATGNLIFGTVMTGGGGGGTTTTDRQRIEALAFTAVGATTTQLQQQTLGATPASVIYGDGAIEMVAATAAETTFTILDAGVYLMEWNAVITPAADRPEPCLRVLADADDALLGETDPLYIRASSEGAYIANRTGILVVPADNTVVKAIVLNCRNDNSFSVAAGHSLHIIRGAQGAAGSGADNFVGARAGISPVRTGQNYGTLTTLTWDVEEFDVGGFFDPASNTRMTVPSGVVYAVVHGGVTLGGFANTGDLFIDILKNGVSLGIGSTTKNIGISTVARTSVTTGVVEVSQGDYFELAIEVIQDTSVSLQSIGTFFSCHASSTEIGGAALTRMTM